MILLQISLFVLGIVLAAAVALVAFIVWRNQIDKRQLEHTLNEDYPKPKPAEHTEDPDDLKGS
jgi:phosphoglycerate-specific signal transduction histidine kinase